LAACRRAGADVVCGSASRPCAEPTPPPGLLPRHIRPVPASRLGIVPSASPPTHRLLRLVALQRAGATCARSIATWGRGACLVEAHGLGKVRTKCIGRTFIAAALPRSAARVRRQRELDSPARATSPVDDAAVAWAGGSRAGGRYTVELAACPLPVPVVRPRHMLHANKASAEHVLYLLAHNADFPVQSRTWPMPHPPIKTTSATYAAVKGGVP